MPFKENQESGYYQGHKVNFTVRINDTNTFDFAQVTTGGVSTLRSILHDGIKTKERPLPYRRAD